MGSEGWQSLPSAQGPLLPSYWGSLHRGLQSPSRPAGPTHHRKHIGTWGHRPEREATGSKVKGQGSSCAGRLRRGKSGQGFKRITGKSQISEVLSGCAEGAATSALSCPGHSSSGQSDSSEMVDVPLSEFMSSGQQVSPDLAAGRQGDSLPPVQGNDWLAQTIGLPAVFPQNQSCDQGVMVHPG